MKPPGGSPGRYWQNWDQGRAARLIDEYWTGDPREAEWREMLARDIRQELGTDATVLEAGCGSGLVYGALLRHQVIRPDSYAGEDMSEKMLEIARERFPGVRFSKMDILALPSPDRAHDAVVCVDVLQHLPYYDVALRELVRVTGRKLYIASWFTPGPEDAVAFSPPYTRFDNQSFHDNCYSLPRFVAALRSCEGREIVDTRIHQFLGRRYAVCATFAPGRG